VNVVYKMHIAYIVTCSE